MKAFVFCIVFLTGTYIFGQNTQIFMELPESSDSLSISENPELQTKNKIKAGVNLNMGYTFSKYYSGPMMSFSPYLIYPVSDRFYISAGILAGYGTNYMQVLSSERNTNKLLPMTNAYIYASGNYLVNQKLVISATAYKGLNTVPNLTRQNSFSSYSNTGGSVGFNYKIAPGFTFGAQIHINSNGSNSLGTGYYGLGNEMFNPYGW